MATDNTKTPAPYIFGSATVGPVGWHPGAATAPTTTTKGPVGWRPGAVAAPVTRDLSVPTSRAGLQQPAPATTQYVVSPYVAMPGTSYQVPKDTAVMAAQLAEMESNDRPGGSGGPMVLSDDTDANSFARLLPAAGVVAAALDNTKKPARRPAVAPAAGTVAAPVAAVPGSTTRRAVSGPREDTPTPIVAGAATVAAQVLGVTPPSGGTFDPSVTKAAEAAAKATGMNLNDYWKKQQAALAPVRTLTSDSFDGPGVGAPTKAAPLGSAPLSPFDVNPNLTRELQAAGYKADMQIKFDANGKAMSVGAVPAPQAVLAIFEKSAKGYIDKSSEYKVAQDVLSGGWSTKTAQTGDTPGEASQITQGSYTKTDGTTGTVKVTDFRPQGTTPGSYWYDPQGQLREYGGQMVQTQITTGTFSANGSAAIPMHAYNPLTEVGPGGTGSWATTGRTAPAGRDLVEGVFGKQPAAPTTPPATASGSPVVPGTLIAKGVLEQIAAIAASKDTVHLDQGYVDVLNQINKDLMGDQARVMTLKEVQDAIPLGGVGPAVVPAVTPVAAPAAAAAPTTPAVQPIAAPAPTPAAAPAPALVVPEQVAWANMPPMIVPDDPNKVMTIDTPQLTNPDEVSRAADKLMGSATTGNAQIDMAIITQDYKNNTAAAENYNGGQGFTAGSAAHARAIASGI